MELTFNLDADDYADFARYAKARVEKIADARSKLAGHAYAFYILLGMAVAGLFYFVSENRGRPLGHLYTAILLLVGWLLCAHWYGRRRYALHLKHYCAPDGFFQQQQRLIANGTELVLARNNSTQTYQWSAIKDLAETKRLLLLCIDNAQAICIPRRAFSSSLAESEFLTLVRSYVPSQGR